jgi:S-adenosylmethionine hydrolase
VPMNTMGTQIDDPIRLSLPKPRRVGNRLHGEVIYIDRFGSLVTNIHRSDLRTSQVLIQFGDSQVRGLVRTFGDRPPGSLIALFSSTGDLLISVVNGSAAERLGVQIGEPFEILLPEVVTSDRY